MKPPARAIVGQLVWSADGGVWATWRVEPLPHANTSMAAKLATHARLRGLLMGLAGEALLLSVCERLDPWDVVGDMVEGIDLESHPRWAEVCDATATVLADAPLHRRRHYLSVSLPRPPGATGWRGLLAHAAGEVAAGFGIAPTPVSASELETRRRQASAVEARLGGQLALEPVSAGELRWLYARALRRGLDEPPFDDSWEPPLRSLNGGRRQPGVVRPLTDAVVFEGGTREDADRPRHHRYLRVDAPRGTAYQAVLAMADLPHEWTFPGGGGEWLAHVDDVDFPVDWAVRVRVIPNADAQAKVRRQQRQLLGQVEEYDGEVTGAPPSLAEAIAAADDQRAALAANPTEPELQVTILLAIAATSLPHLEDRASALQAMFEPHDYGLGRPTGAQAALLRSMLPGAAAAPACRHYTQFLLARDLAAGAPFCGAPVGDPRGLLLAVSLESGVPTPVLCDPTWGPSVGRTASLAAVGALGSGKSYALKRLCWDTLARGGQVVTIDRTARGEYVSFAETAPGSVQVVRLAAGTDVCLDPMRVFTGDDRVSTALGFLALLAGASPQSEEGAALAEAVHLAADRPGSCLVDVVDELAHMGSSKSRPDPAARSLARRLDHYRRLGVGQLAFGNGEALRVDADFIVFWAPNLALPDRDTLLNEHLARQMLPEQVLGHAVLYLIAAVGRQVVFSDPGRFGAALYDEAWALLGSPYGAQLLLEGVRDGRKHNGAIWLASQHPADLITAGGELVDLLGPRFVFRQAPGAVDAALGFLGAAGSDEAAAVLTRGLGPGQCLYRDVSDRVGLIQVLEPALADVAAAFDTNPTAPPAARTPSPQRDGRAEEASEHGGRRHRRTPVAAALARPHGV